MTVLHIKNSFLMTPDKILKYLNFLILQSTYIHIVTDLQTINFYIFPHCFRMLRNKPINLCIILPRMNIPITRFGSLIHQNSHHQQILISQLSIG